MESLYDKSDTWRRSHLDMSVRYVLVDKGSRRYGLCRVDISFVRRPE